MARVMVLADLLETCKFKQFWEELAKCGDLTITIHGFDDAIRKFVARSQKPPSARMRFKRAPLSRL